MLVQVAVSDSAARSADVLLARVEMLEGDVKTLRGSLKQSNAVNKKLEVCCCGLLPADCFSLLLHLIML